MAKPKRTNFEREHAYDQIAGLYLKGYTQAAIAEELGVSQPQISYDLKKIQERWSKSSLRDFDAAKGEELAKLDELERTYWDAWRASGGTVRIKSVDRERIVLDEENKVHKGAKAQGVAGQDGEIIRKSVRTETKVGEAEYLKGVQRCIEQRCKILGLLAPQKIAPTNITGDAEYGSDPASDEGRINKLVAVFDLARARASAATPGSDTPTNLGTAGGAANSSS